MNPLSASLRNDARTGFGPGLRRTALSVASGRGGLGQSLRARGRSRLNPRLGLSRSASLERGMPRPDTARAADSQRAGIPGAGEGRPARALPTADCVLQPRSGVRPPFELRPRSQVAAHRDASRKAPATSRFCPRELAGAGQFFAATAGRCKREAPVAADRRHRSLQAGGTGRCKREAPVAAGRRHRSLQARGTGRGRQEATVAASRRHQPLQGAGNR